MNSVELQSLLHTLGLRGVVRRQGNFMACCPAHEERRPSWGISISEPHMHGCFSCGFRGSLPSLLRHFGYTRNQIETLAGPQLESSIESLAFNFHDSVPEPVKVPEFNLYPFVFNHDLVRYAQLRGLELSTVRKAGLLYDRSSRRMVMPWYWNNELIGATGRATYDGPGVNKIIAYFGLQKGLNLYVPSRRLEPESILILVEGEIDALRVYQAGFQNVAALAFGTFTETQKKRVLALSPSRVVLFFDSDDAGQRLTEATIRSLESSAHVVPVKYSSSLKGSKVDPAFLGPVKVRSMIKAACAVSRFSLGNFELASPSD